MPGRVACPPRRNGHQSSDAIERADFEVGDQRYCAEAGDSGHAAPGSSGMNQAIDTGRAKRCHLPGTCYTWKFSAGYYYKPDLRSAGDHRPGHPACVSESGSSVWRDGRVRRYCLCRRSSHPAGVLDRRAGARNCESSWCCSFSPGRTGRRSRRSAGCRRRMPSAR